MRGGRSVVRAFVIGKRIAIGMLSFAITGTQRKISDAFARKIAGGAGSQRHPPEGHDLCHLARGVESV